VVLRVEGQGCNRSFVADQATAPLLAGDVPQLDITTVLATGHEATGKGKGDKAKWRAQVTERGD
jgi:hypothetical protein